MPGLQRSRMHKWSPVRLDSHLDTAGIELVVAQTERNALEQRPILYVSLVMGFKTKERRKVNGRGKGNLLMSRIMQKIRMG